MDAVERIGLATDQFVSALLEIAREYKPRGGCPFPPAVVETLSYESPVIPKPLIEFANRLIPPGLGARCLDFGCGAGPHRRIIETSGYVYTGVDYAASIDPARLARQGSSFENEVVQYDGLTLPFDDATFDMIWAWSSLEHCIFPEKSFSEIGRVLKPGGAFVGSVPHMMTYHAESAVNFTPYGFYLSCQRHEMTPLKIIPNMDGFSFFIKSLMISLGTMTDPVPIDQHFRKNQVAPLFLELFTRAGHRPQLPLQLHAELCGEFGFVVRKDT